MSNGKHLPSASQELYPRRPTASDTIVVLGCPRGGTSMISGILRLLGVHMGSELDEANNEDLEFTIHQGNRLLFEDPSSKRPKAEFVDHIRALIRKRNEDHDSWGWKDPISSYYIGDVLSELRSPRVICVIRDAAAVTGRQLLSRDADDGRDNALARVYGNQFRAALRQYGDVIDFVTAERIPALMVSYERATRHPQDIVREISRFTGRALPTDEDALRKLMDYVMPERNSGNIDVEISRPARPAPALLPADMAAGGDDGLDALRALDHAYQAALETAVEEDGPLPSAEHENCRIILQSMAAANKAGDFDRLQRDGFRLIDAMSYRSPELGHHPRIIHTLLAGPDGTPWPPAALQLFFKLGMKNMQVNDPATAHWYFACIVRYLEQRPRRYRGQPFPAPFWGALFHLGLSARITGQTSLARQVFARIVHAGVLGLEPDTAALDEEPQEHAVYAKRAAAFLGG